MSTYSTISDDYTMFDTKAPVNYHNDITNYVTVEEMMDYMLSVLTEYERCMSEKQDARINPMSGRVQMKLKNGLTFELPQNIQKLAIVKYMEMKNKNQNIEKFDSVSNENDENGENDDDENDDDAEDDVEQNDEQNNVEEFSNCYNKMKRMVPRKLCGSKLTTLLTMVILIVLVYAIYKYFLEERQRPDF